MVSPQFTLIHAHKTDSTVKPHAPEGWLHVETCQRLLWIGFNRMNAHSYAHSFEGTDAYAFLLEVATGLESAVPGETEIFAQLKESWATYRGPQLSELSPIFQNLFADTKEIRSLYLRGLGGSSYGTLARRWLDPKSGDQILVLGAGALAQAVVPIFLDYQLSVLNRSRSTLGILRKKLEKQSKSVDVNWLIQDEKPVNDPWARADHILVCRPTVEEDQERIAYLLGRSERPRVIHLGLRRGEESVWNQIPSLGTLDDLFDLQKSQASVRDLRFSQARRACRDKAILRSLGGHATLPHGWEDLAAFAE